MMQLEALIELKSLNSSWLSLSSLFQLHQRFSVEQTVRRRAVRGNSSSVRSTLTPPRSSSGLGAQEQGPKKSG